MYSGELSTVANYQTRLKALGGQCNQQKQMDEVIYRTC